MDRRQFASLVRQALAHLYDQAYLQGHPLAAVLVPEAGREAAGQILHRLLLEAIGSLRPPPRVPPGAAAWRPYMVLSLRYLEGLDREQVAEEVGISPRQFRREQLRGLAALADLLWARYEQRSAADPAGAPQALLDAEVVRLGGAPAGGSTPLSETVQGVLSVLTGLATRRQVAIACALPPDLPLVSMERVALRQALLNTLSHAIERGDGGEVSIVARLTEQGLALTIKRRRATASGEARPDQDGRLAVAARLLETQSATLNVEHGSGLDIRLTLPVRRSPTVLVIDDNPDVIQLFQRYLGGGAYQVVGATDGRQALELAQRIGPQAITLDVMMAGQDGWDLLQALKGHAATRGIPVIVCSVLRERNLALSLGAADFIAKPVTQGMLLEALRHCIAPPAEAGHPAGP